MGGFSRQKSTKSTSTPIFHETWLPQQQEIAGEILPQMRSIMAGEFSSPMARMLQQIATEQGMSQAAIQSAGISGAAGMSAPAKARAIAGLRGQAVGGAAGIPQQIWSQVAQYLGQYIATSPQVTGGQVSRTRGGGGFGFNISNPFAPIGGGVIPAGPPS